MRWRYLLAGIATVMVVTVMAAAWWAVSLGPLPLGKDLEYSRLVLDREGRLLRAYATSEGRWRLPATAESVDPRFLELLFAYEDKRFYSHFGVDPLAIGRAALQFATHGRIISGASTLTMQVARLLEPRGPRSIAAKLRQMTRALQIEYALDKKQILSLYLSIAPYGGNLEGVRAASLAYFGKEPRRLSLGQAALLVALPQAPELRRPDRFPVAARRARDRVLDRVGGNDAFPREEIAQAKSEPMPDGRTPMPLLAPHAANDAIAAAPEESVHRLTIDARLQKKLETLARERARVIGRHVSVAILAVDNIRGAVLARVGTSDFFDDRRDGQVDMTHAVRSPGSTLKPFIYGLAFEDGFLHPETLIDDRPVRYGGYAPENFDLTFQGTVTVRRALQLSLNVPAVAVLDKVGGSRLSARLAHAGARLVLPKGEAPGLAIGLGGIGISLADLVTLYSGLARQGVALPLHERPGAEINENRRLLDPVAAWYVGNVLIGAPPPVNAPPRRIAFKTGTSYGYRDAWAIGFDGNVTIGVWVGRPDGAPVPGMLGHKTAAPILFDAFARTGMSLAALPPAPAGTIIAGNGKLPPPLQHYRPGALPSEATTPPRIMFPPNGARLELAGAGNGGSVAMKIAGGTKPLTVLVNGEPQPVKPGRRTLFFQADGPGFVRLTVLDARGAADSVMVRIGN